MEPVLRGHERVGRRSSEVRNLRARRERHIRRRTSWPNRGRQRSPRHVEASLGAGVARSGRREADQGPSSPRIDQEHFASATGEGRRLLQTRARAARPADSPTTRQTPRSTSRDAPLRWHPRRPCLPRLMLGALVPDDRHPVRHGPTPEGRTPTFGKWHRVPGLSKRDLEVAFFQDVLCADFSGAEPSFTNPATDRFGIPPASACGFRYRQHVA